MPTPAPIPSENVFLLVLALCLLAGSIASLFLAYLGQRDRNRTLAQQMDAFEEAGAAKDALSYILQDMHSAEKLRDSSRLAHLVQEQLAKALPFENRGVMQADFIVLRDTRMPSVLIELGFLTNPREEKVLKEPKTHTEIAFAIRRGVMQFWELVKRKQVRSVQGKKIGR